MSGQQFDGTFRSAVSDRKAKQQHAKCLLFNMQQKLANIILTLIVVVVIVHATQSLLASAQVNEPEQKQQENELPPQSWEYEPRVWVPEQQDFDNDIELLEMHDADEEAASLAGSGQTATGPSDSELRAAKKFWTNPHDRRNVEREFKNKAANIWRRKWIRQVEQQVEEECSQFRADIRETVICDKRQCEKFDFDWPKYDNQIVHIETTKHGMRFYRAEYAFATARSTATALDRAYVDTSSYGDTWYREQVRNVNDANGQSPDRLKPVKFDLFDLFKPKPTKQSSTVSPVTSPLPPTTSTRAPTTDDSNEQPETPSTTRPDDCDPTLTPPPPPSSPNGTNSSRLVTTLRLDTRRRMQTMLGFGGALSDSTCRNVKSLSNGMAKSLMEDYFGQRGLRYNIARVTMGSSDFSTTPYTNNDAQPAGNEQRRAEWSADDDVDMKRFRLVEEDYEYKLPIARQAIATSRQEIKFFSSLWSPPVWMKNNSNIVHGYLKGDIYGPYYKALADYMIKWLEAYRKNGIEFWGTTGLNEPITGIKPFIFHNSLGITREDYVTFIKLYLGPMLRQRGFRDTKLIIMDDNKGYAPNFVRAVLDDNEAAKYVAGIGVHWYMNDEYENLNFLSRQYPDKFLISTEACNGYLPFQVHTLPGNWDRGVAYMYDIIKVIQKGAVAWVDWNMALNVAGGPSWAKNNLDAAVIVNAQRDEYYKSPMFYAMGHFSKFVERNSSRLDHRLANARYNRPLETVAFYTPNKYVVIVTLNTNKHPVPYRIIVDQQLVKIVTLRQESFSTIIFKWKSDRS